VTPNDNLLIVAGQPVHLKLETRTTNAALRTNYFFSNPQDNIKLKFTGE